MNTSNRSEELQERREKRSHKSSVSIKLDFGHEFINGDEIEAQVALISIMINLIILISQAVAAPQLKLKVDSAKTNYFLEIKKNELTFNSPNKNVEQKIKPCGQRAYDLFISKIESQIDGDLTKMSKPSSPQSMKIEMNNKKHFVLPLSTAGITVAKVETEIDYLISEATYRCSQK